MSEKPIILVVDDEPINIEILIESLEQLYQVEVAETAKECLERLQTLKPEIILLDVNMPEMSGIEACKTIKENPETSDIPVLFLSALGLPEQRMQGYKAGGDDYIIKPFEEEELLFKIKLTLVSQKEKNDLQQGSNDAMSMAMTAMTQASEMGVVMQFSRDSYQCNSHETLAKCLLESLTQFDLNATLRITLNKQDQFYSSLGTVSEKEQEVMEHVREKGRFIHYGKHTLVNFDNISLFVKNMPVEDEDKYGRINDVLGMLVESADVRIVGIELSSSLLKLIHSTREILSGIESSHKENEQKSTKIMTDLIEKIEWSFIHMGLNEQQEEYFIELLKKAKSMNQALYTADLQVNADLEKVIASLSVVPKTTQ